jgi:hypothetical protein
MTVPSCPFCKDQDVHDPDDPSIMEPDEFRRPFAGEVLSPHWELDDQEIDGP